MTVIVPVFENQNDKLTVKQKDENFSSEEGKI